MVINVTTGLWQRRTVNEILTKVRAGEMQSGGKNAEDACILGVDELATIWEHRWGNARIFLFTSNQI